MSSVPSWFYRQSAVIPYRLVAGKIEVLLITSHSRKRWVIPKGVVELTLTAAASAAREAYEEAGVIGTVSDRSVGVYEYEKWGGICRVEVFLMDVHTILDDWPESGERGRAWMRPKEAAETVREKELKKMLIALAGSISSQ